MRHESDVGLQAVAVSRLSSPGETPSGRARVMRTPPGVWPQVSQADVGRVVRRLRGTAEHVREVPEPPRMRLVSGG